MGISANLRRFAQLSHEYLIEQLQFTGDESITGMNERVKLNLNHPVKELIWVVQRDAVLGLSASNDWTNYTTGSTTSLTNPGSNCVSTAKLQLNGQDRMAQRDGTYFNLVQPFQHHENVSANKGINVYSFALKPEEHQPSGTLNFSRIDTAVLQLGLVAGVPNAKIKTYAVNYNVLRIMSGMGGLSFANFTTLISLQDQDLKAAVHSKESSYYGKILCVLSNFTPTPAASVGKFVDLPMQHILLFGKPLTAFSTKGCCESATWPRVMNSGTQACGMQGSMVITKRIGRSACSLPNGAIVADGRASETERIWVTNDGLTNQRWLKIQSIPLGKLRGTRVHIPTRSECYNHTPSITNTYPHQPSFLPMLACHPKPPFAPRQLIMISIALPEGKAIFNNQPLIFALP